MKAKTKKKRNWKQYWFVVRELTDREIKRRYSRSKLGILWSVLNPLLNMAVISFIFSYMFEGMIENYSIYYLCGQVVFNVFSEGTNASMSALVDNKIFLLQMKTPMRVFVISRVYTALVNFGYSLIAFIPILIFFKIKITWTILFLPVIIVIFTFFVLGVSYMLSVACVFFGDLGHLYGIFTTLLLFMSAIFYPIESLSGTARVVIAHNPTYIFNQCVRKVVYMNQLPTTNEMLSIVIWAVVLYIIGVQVFNSNKNKIIQKI